MAWNSGFPVAAYFTWVLASILHILYRRAGFTTFIYVLPPSSLDAGASFAPLFLSNTLALSLVVHSAGELEVGGAEGRKKKYLAGR